MIYINEQSPMQNRRVKKASKARFVFKRLAIWLAISLVLQAGVLTYLTYWAGGHSKPKEISVSARNKIKTKESFKFTSVGEVKLYSVSYDAKYVALVDNDGLKIYDLRGKKTIYKLKDDREKAHEARTNREIDYPQGTRFQVTYLKWLPDRNKIMYVLEWSNYKGGPVNIDVYISDINGSLKTRVAKFNGRAPKTTVKNIALSTMSNLIYIQLESPYKTSELFQVDIMSSMTPIAGSNREVGKIAASPKDGILYAEIFNRKGNPPKISVVKNSVLDVFDEQDNYRLLGVDQEGKVYVGEQSLTGIKTIYTSTVKMETRENTVYEYDKETESTKKKVVTYTDVQAYDLTKLMELNTTVEPDKIYVLNNGEIIIDNSPDSDSITLYTDGVEKKKTDIDGGKKEILLYNKYVAVLKESVGNENELVIYNLDVN